MQHYDELVNSSPRRRSIRRGRTRGAALRRSPWGPPAERGRQDWGVVGAHGLRSDREFDVTDASTSAAQPQAKRRRFPVHLLEGVRPVDRRRVPKEVIAGVTLAALAIPEVMGYTSIAGMPVITGLYTILVPLALFALLGSSRHLVVGADSATAAIMAAGLAGLAATGSVQYVALAGMLAIIDGGLPAAGPRASPRLPGRLPLANGAHRLLDGRRHPGGLRPVLRPFRHTRRAAAGPFSRS